jgi:ATP-dependent DNA helicase RecG
MARRVEELLARGEGAGVDFKVDASSVRGIVKDFVAFGNSAGGSILVGVDDERNVVGLEDPQGTEEAIAKSVYDSTEPPQRPLISVLTQDEKEVVLVEAQYFQGADPLQLTDGGDSIVYERVGSNSIPVTDARLEQLRRERRGRDGFDQLAATGATLEDLDMEAIVGAFAARRIEIDESKLEGYELAKRENGELIPTYAGILLFGKDPNAFLPDAYFRGIRYPGSNQGGDALDSAEWNGMSLLKGVDEVERFIARNTGTAQTIPGTTRRDIPHYEPSVLREVLHNVVAHSDYSRLGQHLNVSIFSDRMQVDSPGTLPAGMTFEALEGGVSLARNRAIMSILHLIGYVEKHGTVYAKALAATNEGYPMPEWCEPGPVVRVVLRPYEPPMTTPPPPKAKQRRNREAEVFQHLRRVGEKTAADLADELGISGRQTRTYLKRLENAGRVQPVGSNINDPKRVYRALDEVGG